MGSVKRARSSSKTACLAQILEKSGTALNSALHLSRKDVSFWEGFQCPGGSQSRSYDGRGSEGAQTLVQLTRSCCRKC
jgi:hypothetical protein